MASQHVAIELPGFELRQRWELNGTLERLGMRLPFDSRRADFGGISSPPLWISAIEQSYPSGQARPVSEWDQLPCCLDTIVSVCIIRRTR
jgi:hypothetical protein